MCCGMNRSQLRARSTQSRSSQPSVPDAPKQAPLTSFIYAGNTSLTVTGPISGIEYRFDRPGARLEVDARDRVLLASLRQLQQVV